MSSSLRSMCVSTLIVFAGCNGGDGASPPAAGESLRLAGYTPANLPLALLVNE
jgi:hypothetical protein